MYNSLIILDLQSIWRLGYGMENRIVAVRLLDTETNFSIPMKFLDRPPPSNSGVEKHEFIATSQACMSWWLIKTCSSITGLDRP
jgi:hypothetical protein